MFARFQSGHGPAARTRPRNPECDRRAARWDSRHGRGIIHYRELCLSVASCIQEKGALFPAATYPRYFIPFSAGNTQSAGCLHRRYTRLCVSLDDARFSSLANRADRTSDGISREFFPVVSTRFSFYRYSISTLEESLIKIAKSFATMLQDVEERVEGRRYCVKRW